MIILEGSGRERQGRWRLAGLYRVVCLLWRERLLPCQLNFAAIMALHVPRAPGFASMLKDGARVRIDLPKDLV